MELISREVERTFEGWVNLPGPKFYMYIKYKKEVWQCLIKALW